MGCFIRIGDGSKKRNVAYTIHDSFYQQSRIFKLKLDNDPVKISQEFVIHDTLGVLAAVEPVLVNNDNTVNLDAEGIAISDDGCFWVVSEGDDAPILLSNLLLKIAKTGEILKVVTLPDSVKARMSRFGFEGVTTMGKGANEIVYVVFQREWENDKENHVRIGRFQVENNEWSFYYYPIEKPLSDNGGWVGLSEISALGNNEFAVIERDNQGGPDAEIKRIYKFSIDGLTPLVDPPANSQPEFPVVTKTLMHDLIPDLKATGGLILEKIEGLAFTRDNKALVVNDNDGVNNSNGETQLLRININR